MFLIVHAPLLSCLDHLPLYLSPVFQSSLCEFLCVVTIIVGCPVSDLNLCIVFSLLNKVCCMLILLPPCFNHIVTHVQEREREKKHFFLITGIFGRWKFQNSHTYRIQGQVSVASVNAKFRSITF